MLQFPVDFSICHVVLYIADHIDTMYMYTISFFKFILEYIDNEVDVQIALLDLLSIAPGG